jgi:transposase
MPRPYSQELRVRVIEAVEGGASRRDVAEPCGISPSVVVIWMQRWIATASIKANPSGGSTSLDEHADFCSA